MLENLINAIQVGMTVCFILFCILLLRTWHGSFFDTTSRDLKDWTAEQWLIVGIVVGFSGNALDNFYWGLHWLSDLYNHESQPILLAYGPVSNLLTRQLPGIVSVYCHLRAAHAITKANYSLQDRSGVYILIGLASFVFVWCTSQW